MLPEDQRVIYIYIYRSALGPSCPRPCISPPFLWNLGKVCFKRDEKKTNAGFQNVAFPSRKWPCVAPSTCLRVPRGTADFFIDSKLDPATTASSRASVGSTSKKRATVACVERERELFSHKLTFDTFQNPPRMNARFLKVVPRGLNRDGSARFLLQALVRDPEDAVVFS